MYGRTDKPSKEELKHLKEVCTKGTRVRLQYMNDVQAPPVGTMGTVMCVDDLGTIHVQWDTGSTLGVAWNCDLVQVVE